MRTQQVSAFLENRPGRLLYLFSTVAAAGINVLAHNLVDASDFGIVHLLLDNPQGGLQAIQKAGLTASSTIVLQLTVPDEPGALVTRILEPLAKAGVNIEYSYAYAERCSGEARTVFKVDDLDKAEEVLDLA